MESLYFDKVFLGSLSSLFSVGTTEWSPAATKDHPTPCRDRKGRKCLVPDRYPPRICTCSSAFFHNILFKQKSWSVHFSFHFKNRKRVLSTKQNLLQNLLQNIFFANRRFQSLPLTTFSHMAGPCILCGVHKNKAKMHMHLILAWFAARVHSGRNTCIFFFSHLLFIRSDNASSIRLNDLNGLVVCMGVTEQSLAQGMLTTQHVVPAFLPK